MSPLFSRPLERSMEDRVMDQEIVYEKLPTDIADRYVLLMDPILGTGGSAARAVKVRRRSRRAAGTVGGASVHVCGWRGRGAGRAGEQAGSWARVQPRPRSQPRAPLAPSCRGRGPSSCQGTAPHALHSPRCPAPAPHPLQVLLDKGVEEGKILFLRWVGALLPAQHCRFCQSFGSAAFGAPAASKRDGEQRGGWVGGGVGVTGTTASHHACGAAPCQQRRCMLLHAPPEPPLAPV